MTINECWLTQSTDVHGQNSSEVNSIASATSQQNLVLILIQNCNSKFSLNVKEENKERIFSLSP